MEFLGLYDYDTLQKSVKTFTKNYCMMYVTAESATYKLDL